MTSMSVAIPGHVYDLALKLSSRKGKKIFKTTSKINLDTLN